MKHQPCSRNGTLTWLGLGIICVTLALAGCRTPHVQFKYPATATPSDLRLTMRLLTSEVRVGEPILVTTTISNVTDTSQLIHLQSLDWQAGFRMFGTNGDTWLYNHLGFAPLIAMDPRAFYRIGAKDSIYWRHLLWPQHFFRQDVTTWPGPGTYRLAGAHSPPWFLEDGSQANIPFILADTSLLEVVPDSQLSARLEPYHLLLDTLLRHHYFSPWLASAESLLAETEFIAQDFDSTYPYLEYLLPDMARRLDGRKHEALALAECFRVRYPDHPLAEEMLGWLPLYQELVGQERKADSLARLFVTTYPRNAAALRTEKGQELWRMRE